MDYLPKIPGKTSPRLIIDVRLYDPRSEKAHNPLRQPPSSYLDHNFRPPFNNASRCEHIFTTKTDQTYLRSPKDDSPTTSLEKVAGICQICRWHIDITLEHPDESTSTCPNQNYPLHFFVLSDQPNIEPVLKHETYAFACTGCQSKLEVHYRPPRLENSYFELLTDPQLLRERYEQAVQHDPERQTLQEQPGIKVLEALSSYMQESLKPTRADASVPADNKRFMTSFGSDCDALLLWLGFSKKEAVVQEGIITEPAIWTLPKAPPADAFHESSRHVLEDVMEELHAKMRYHPDRELKTLKYQPPYPTPLDKPLQSMLHAQSYATSLSRLRSPEVGVDQYYTGLGAVVDFADSLIEFCFRRQVAQHPASSSYYFDCLSGIASKRESEELSMAVAMLASEGYVTTDEVLEAYRSFGFRADQTLSITDTDILGTFNSRLESSPRHQEGELRDKLRVIGRARGSASLVGAADNAFDFIFEYGFDASETEVSEDSSDSSQSSRETVTRASSEESRLGKRAKTANSHNTKIILTKSGLIRPGGSQCDFQNAEQALKWLDSTYNGSVHISDESIIALAAAKKADRNDQAELCKKAVELIAEERNSETLRVWARDGISSSDVREEEISAAYRYFQIPDRSVDLDFDVLANYLDQGDDTRNAEALRHYNVLLEQSSQRAQPVGPPAYDRPVGLENIGNTCYLNCLLQFLYTVKPVRELILDFDEFKLNTLDDNFVAKKVDSVVVPKAETELSQQFVHELQTLFHEMANDPRPAVRPSWDLAKLALQRSTVPAPHRRSTIGGDIPFLKSPIRTQPPPLPENSIVGSSPVKATTTNSSEVTLIDEPTTRSDRDNDSGMIIEAADGMLTPVRTESPTSEIDPMDESETAPLLPARPPPVPPRPISDPPAKIDTQNSAWKDDSAKREAEQAAQQQDVEEAMSNVLFKLQCSIRNTESLAGGGSTDKINQLFYGSYLWKYLDSKIEDNNELFTTINISLLQKPKTISAGLDSCFGLDEVMLESKQTRRYRTITSIPPIFQVYLQRQEFDPNRQDTVIVKHHIQLDEVIYMDRFMTLGDKNLHDLREKAWRLDARLGSLQDSQGRYLSTTTGLEGPDLVDAAWQILDTHGELINSDDTTLVDDLKNVANQKRAKASATTTRILELETQRQALFADYRKHAYRLAAVFVHRGQGGSMGGHYWIYIYDFKESKWRRYEDRDVRDVADPQEEIFSAKDPESQGAPYFVVYVRDETKDEIVDALWRVEAPETVDETHDSEMADEGAAVEPLEKEQMQS